jgi:glutathione S-transferase
MEETGMPEEKNMRLHCGIGPNSYRVRIFMAEKGIDVPRVDVDLTTAEHRSAEFRKLNSLAQIPVLELADGTVITESVAICRYFEELHPNPALFGTDAISRAKVEMWNRRAEFEIFGTIGNIALHSDALFKDRLAQFPAFAETQRDAVPAKWAWLDRELDDGRAFLAGDRFSVADITGAVAAWLGDFFGAEMPAALTNVNRWLGRVRERPSWNA